jgi:hypothetical protein
LELKAMAEKNQREYRDRKDLEPGFDTVEHDLSNAIKLGWDFITR